MTLRRLGLFANVLLWTELLVGQAVARADIIYSNFGPGQSYTVFNGNPVGNGFDGTMSYAQGEAFTPSQDYRVTSIQVALFLAVNGDELFPGATSTPITVALTKDAGNQPGQVIESFTLPSNSIIGPEGAYNTPFEFNTGPDVLLAGAQYWVTVSDGTTIDGIRWNWTDPISTTSNENATSTDAGASWAVQGRNDGAFEVDGTPLGVSPLFTPEPNDWVLFASGGMSLMAAWIAMQGIRIGVHKG